MYGCNDYWKYGYSNTSNCYNIGKVGGNNFIGGIAGANGTNCSIYSCYYEENTFSYGVNSNKDIGTTKLPMADMPSIISVINGDNAFVEDADGINDGYPILAWQVQETV